MALDSYIVETASLRWLRFPIWFQKATCLVDLPNDLALNIYATSGKIEVYSKSMDGTYRQIETLFMEEGAISKRKAFTSRADRFPVEQLLKPAKEG